MAQTLAVYHYGYYTLKAGQIQSHGPALVPSDTAAVLDWGLDIPFTSLDKPPLAITMIVTVNGERSLRRYRLVIAQKSKLRLTPAVLATLASQGRDHRLTASGFSPCSIDREYLYGYAADGYRSPLWLCASHNGNPVLVHRQRGTKIFSITPSRTGSCLHFRASTTSTLTSYELICYRLRSSNLILAPAISQDLKEQGTQWKILPRKKSETPRMLRPMLKRLWMRVLVSTYPGHAR